MNRIFTLVAGLTVVFGGALSEAAPIPATPVHTNKPRFRIPFRYDAAEMQSLGAKEIRLFVSRDRGANWQPVQSVAPEAGKFNFQAPSDGEYWFFVRTVDAKNRLHPDGAGQEPGLQVIVDTTLPRLQLELKQPAPGKVQLVWAATDDHIDPTQLRLEYVQPGVPAWQAVSVVPKAAGQTEWSVPQGGIVAVRGSISDIAKNIAQDQVQITIVPADQTIPRPQAPDLRQPIASPSVSPDGNLAAILPDQFSAATTPSVVPATPSRNTGEAPLFEPIRSQLPTAGIVVGPGAPRNSFASLQPRGTPPADQGKVTDPLSDPGGQRATGRFRIVNTRQFQVGYKLQDVGPSGVSSVVLYITQDDGATWFKYGEDNDAQSPVHVEVPREGKYGFALGVRSGAGLTTDPPQPGDKPSIVVVVDHTPPRVELLPLEQGRGRAINQIRIPWKLTEEYPAEKPISLSFSATGQPPWQPISGWQDNTGSYIWTIGPGVPSKFYVRLEARDAAGNVQAVETPQPVLVDLSRPTAKIIDVESTAGGLGPQ